jgi:penicillin-binding protein 1A
MARQTLRHPLKKTLSLLRRRWWLFAGGVVALVIISFLMLFLGAVPLPEALASAQSSKVLAADGQLIGTFHGEENRTIVPLDQVSMNLQNAVVATEDRSFYEHPGVSLKGIIRAVFTNVSERGVRQGGSTITQQYVRNSFEQVGRERTIFRKVKEAVLAVKIERKFSKAKILEFYLNTVYFGRGAYGAEAAARSYFSKSAKDLNVNESAYLAGSIRAPQRFQPDSNPDSAESIRKEVLSDMVEAGKLKKEEAEANRAQPLGFQLAQSVEAQSARAAYFLEYVKQILYNEFKLTDREIFGGGLTVRTTLDLRLQDLAEKAITSTLDREDDPEAALVSIDTNGNLRAMVGGRVVNSIERARGFNFATMQRSDGQVNGRQAGSAFKPFTLAAFVQEGKSVKSTFSAPPLLEIPSRQCKNEDGSNWKIHNFDNDGYGNLDVIDATKKSANTVYAQMIDLIKPRPVKKVAEDSGITSKLSAVCSLTLGTSAVTPLEMARAFATFSTRGERVDIVAITKVERSGGDVIGEQASKKEKVMDPRVADTVNFALEQNIQGGTGTGAKIGRPAAGKTGTTQNHVDAWFAGYTPHDDKQPGLSTVVWMGFRPEGSPPKIPEMIDVRGRRVTGGSFPATIWKQYMQDALKGFDAVKFVSPELGGEVINPQPTPCPPATTPPAGANCISPSPSPTPTASLSPSPTPPPGQDKKSPTPPQSPTPSPTPTSPSPSPNQG